jgi:H+/Cl- antiporter ClcA
MSDTGAPQVDYGAVIRSKDYHRLLILCAVIGLVVSFVAWCFLTLVPLIQDVVYTDLPGALGFSSEPWWWPIPFVLTAGFITAFVILRMPGRGGGVPAEGFSAGITQPLAVPGVVLAGLASLGLGLVLGPSSPVLALGMGTALFIISKANKDAPDQVQKVVAAAGGIAALAMVLNNPIAAAIIVIEAMGIGGAMAPVIVLPGLMAAGIGALVYLGMGSLTGLPTEAYALQTLDLQPLESLTVGQFAWVIVVALVTSIVGFLVVEVGPAVERLVRGRVMVMVPIAGVVVGVLAIVFAQITGQPSNAILFSGSRALDPLVEHSATLSVAVLAWLVLFKALAWSVSMGAFRGGPVFPAIFLGTAGGLFAANLPGLPQGAAVPAVVGATVVAVLRLPLSSAVIASIMTASAGLKAIPLTILAIVISYVLVDRLFYLRG